MFGLDEKQFNFVKSMLKKHIPEPEAKFYIFGSRAKGCSKKYSDVDIAIDLPGFTSARKLELELDFENSLFPFEVDIIDLNNIKESFKNLIKNDLSEIIF